MSEDYDILKSYLDAGEDLSLEEWETFFLSGKALVKARLSSWRVILKIEDSQEEGSVRREAAKKCREKVEKEVRDTIVGIGEELQGIMDNYYSLEAPDDDDERFQRFCLKMYDWLIKHRDVVTDKHDLRLGNLSDSVLSQVFTFLDVESLKAVRLVSR